MRKDGLLEKDELQLIKILKFMHFNVYVHLLLFVVVYIAGIMKVQYDIFYLYSCSFKWLNYEDKF